MFKFRLNNNLSRRDLENNVDSWENNVDSDQIASKGAIDQGLHC